jgi:hypothetical protein
MIGFLALAAAASANPIGVQAIQNFGTCVVEYTPEGVRKVLDLDYTTPEYRQRLRALLQGHDRCAPGSSLGSSQLLFAGSLAEAMLKADVKPAELVQRLSFRPEQGAIVARGPLEVMALCTVMAAPQPTVALLATEAGTAEEKAAFAPLTPVLTNCLQQNTQLTTNRPALRALLALAAWRVASAPRKVAQ